MCGNVLALGPRRRDTILFFSGGSYPPRTYCFQVSNDLSYSFFFFLIISFQCLSPDSKSEFTPSFFLHSSKTACLPCSSNLECMIGNVCK